MDLGQLERIVVAAVSQLVVEQPEIKELDLNPLLASAEALVALDARVLLHGADVDEDALPRPAIRPYPRQYVWPWQTRDGQSLVLRPIRPEDEPLMVTFHETLSDQSVYFRYLHPLSLRERVSHERLSRICFIDYDREIVVVAERRAGGGDRPPEIVGVGRLSKLHWTDDAEFALLVSDHFQKRGLGSELLRRLLDVARGERVRRVVGYISAENATMLALARETGFQSRRQREDPTVVEAWIDV